MLVAEIELLGPAPHLVPEHDRHERERRCADDEPTRAERETDALRAEHVSRREGTQA